MIIIPDISPGSAITSHNSDLSYFTGTNITLDNCRYTLHSEDIVPPSTQTETFRRACLQTFVQPNLSGQI